MQITLAIPMYNEGESIPALIEALNRFTASEPEIAFELIFVNDGSSDDTETLLDAIAEEKSSVTVIHLSRNFGQQAALSAAIDFAQGEAVVFLDADLQDPPDAISSFIKLFKDGYDVVYGIRAQRKESWILRGCYFFFYRILKIVADHNVQMDAGDFALLSRRVVDHLKAAPERNRFLRGLRSWVGYKQIGVPVKRNARTAGDSKYSIFKLFRLAFDGIFAFSTAPLRVATVLGVAGIGVAFIFALYSVAVRLTTGNSPSGFTAIIVFLVFLSGINMACLGVIGEYIGRIYEETKRRPLYIVDRVVSSKRDGS